MKPNFLIFNLVLSLCVFLFPPAFSAPSCPMDLDYVLRIPWNTSECRGYNNPNNTTQISSNSSSPTTGRSRCCQTLLSLYGISLSQHLKKTSLFQLPDLPTSVSCLQDFQTKLTSLSLPPSLTSLCFDPLQFVISPNICASVQSTQDWVKKLGPSTALDSSCKTDLTDLTSCDACVAAGFQVQTDLIGIDGNKSHSTDCFYFAVLYAAGIVNEFGPESIGAVSCIFGLSISSRREVIWEKRKWGLGRDGLLQLLFGNAEFCNEVEIISNLKHRNLVPLRGCCVTENGCPGESERYLVYDYMPNGNLDDHLLPVGESGNSPLTWPQRKNIIMDVAKGLAYLHYGVKPAIYHRDIKATNILLDSDMRARVADFGLAKQSQEGQSHLTTRVAGTHGYLAPEYASTDS
ncbi:UNVERIFIED_CONTAM: putative receptor-like protein kinase [Sesamum angustifolium]|uniref:non-specific serine/threonine protein kinase n=1 Tax=Sesamum angustifolium TaxID=2727405 RepID=A0AAW2NXH0_9LAMI